MSDATELAERLLDAHVAFVVAELTGDGLDAVVAEVVTGLVDALGEVTVTELVDRAAVRATVTAGLDRIGPSPAIAAMVATLVRELRELPASGDHLLGDVVDRAHVEAIVDELASSSTLRDELLARLGRSPALATISMRFVSALVGDAVQQNRKRAERIPGAKLALGMGDFAAKQARGLTPKQLEQAIGGAADKGAQAALERVTRALVDTLDEDAVKVAAMELWDLHAQDTVAGLRAYVDPDELARVADAGHEVWLGLHDHPWLRAAVDAGVGAFFATYGEASVADLLGEFGIPVDELVAEVQRHAPGVVAVLARDGHLDALVRQRLAPFYSSDAALAVLGDA